jgi:hypothetical protein
MGEITVSGVRYQITWWPSLFPIGPSEESFTPIGQLFQLQHDFLSWLKPIGGPWRNEDIFAHPSNMYCLFTETHWSEVVKKFYSIS